jgi:NitT/TauT family transport system permease protein
VRSDVGRSVRRVVLVVVLLVALAAAWELYKVVWQAAGWTWPVRPDDTSMPHVWTMVGALFEPARRGGEEMLGVILLRAALVTFREALLGFLLGTALGLALALIFLKSGVLRRGVMPYVVASQTIPLIAIAPMVVIWVRSNGWEAWLGVAAISAYLTFFPVTVNMLRGLTSPSATSLELMRSYAASDRRVLLHLRLPASLPYLFTALKIGATASVVGALVGELPAGLQDGLGRALLNGAQFYITRPEQLYAAVLITAALGLAFAGVIGIAERIVVPKRPEAAT